MTAPRMRLPGTTYGITAVCDRRELRLVPTAETNAAFAVAIDEARERRGIKLVAYGTTSNHYHAVVHDEHGTVSEFLQDVHSVMARFGNRRDGVRGIGFWERQPVDCVVLADAAAIVGFTAYCIANPVRHFLVARPEEWGGIGTRIEDLGMWRGPVYRRPETFFQQDGWVSEWVELAWELPPLVEAAYGVAGFQRRVRREVERMVERAHREAAERGLTFMGMDKVLSQSVWARPDEGPERGAGLEARARHQVAASTSARTRELVALLLAFRRAHRRAWELMQAGLRALFPPGTWRAWRFYGARREGAPTGWFRLDASTA